MRTAAAQSRPFHVEQTRWRSAVTGQPQGEHVVALGMQALRECAHGVRRVRQAMHEQRTALRRSDRQLDRAVPVQSNSASGSERLPAEYRLSIRAVLPAMRAYTRSRNCSKTTFLVAHVVVERAYARLVRGAELRVELRAVPGFELGTAVEIHDVGRHERKRRAERAVDDEQRRGASAHAKANGCDLRFTAAPSSRYIVVRPLANSNAEERRAEDGVGREKHGS